MKTSLQWAVDFENEADKIEASSPDKNEHPLIRKARIDSLRSMAESLRQDYFASGVLSKDLTK